jgi:hypothetical protein
MYGVDECMRVSEAVPNGRIAELYNPEMFQEHEEVIVFARDEFNRFYTSMRRQIDYINEIDLYFDRSEEWKLIGYWPKILEKVHILDVNIDSLLKTEPIKSYLDASLYNTMRSTIKTLKYLKEKYQYS